MVNHLDAMLNAWSNHLQQQQNQVAQQTAATWANRDFGYPSPSSDGFLDTTLTETSEDCALDWTSLIDTTQHADVIVEDAAATLPSPPQRSVSPNATAQSNRNHKNGGSVRLRLRENETRYRARLDGMFAELKEVVPTLRHVNRGGEQVMSKASRLAAAKNCRKATVLAKTIEYIRYLEESNDNLTARLSHHTEQTAAQFAPTPVSRSSSTMSVNSFESPHRRGPTMTVSPGDLSLADVVDFALQWPI